MKSALITGIFGFVGTHLSRLLLEREYVVKGIDMTGSKSDRFKELCGDPVKLGIDIFKNDLGNIDELKDFLAGSQIDYIFHLAGNAFVPAGRLDPAGMLRSNILTTVNLLQAARDVEWRGRLVFASSSDVYGAAPVESMPLSEESPVAPQEPYAISKLAAENFAVFFNQYDMDVIVARPFNHIGPGQKDDFVLPSFINRIQEALQSNKKSIITGDLKSGRDFTDVRDVARAYELLATRGRAGELYNICSGRATLIKEILDLALEAVGANLDHEVDQSLLRPEGADLRYGSAKKLEALGWQRRCPLIESVRDTYNFMNRKIQAVP